MPTLEVQLAKAQKDLDALPPSSTMYWFMRRRKADDYHGNDATARGLRERVQYLQQRIAVRNERAEHHAAALTLVRLAQTYESVDLPVHTSVPTAPD